MFIFLILLSIFLILILKLKLVNNKYLMVVIKYLLFSLIISISLELTIFNFRHYESLFFLNNKEVNYTLGDGLLCTNNKCKIMDPENAFMEIKNLNVLVKNIYLDISSQNDLILDYELNISDDANELYFKAGKRTYVNSILNSHYIKINASGNTNKIKINLLKQNEKFTINKIKINEKVPMLINNIRVLFVTIISFVLFVVFKKSILHEIKFNDKKVKNLTIIIVFVLIIFFSFLTLFNAKHYTNNQTSQYYQYKNLAKSLYNKHFYLDLKVSPKLLALDNPYDTHYRDEQIKRYEDYYWDHAFYNGKYYTYFGVVPCLLTYLPYYMITKSDMPNNLAMMISLMFFIIVSFYFIYNLISKYFPKTSYIRYLLLSISFLFISGIMNFASGAAIYNLPIIFGVSFAILGLTFYLKSACKSLDGKYLFLGSLCMSLVAGCRPQLLITALFSLIIFWPYFKNKEIFKRENVKNIILFCLPYVLIGLLIMYYNYARFGSIFDFGANYNLTTNDMTKRGIKLGRIPLGLYYFLLAPSKISLVFPFVESTKLTTSYLGVTIYENMYGGVFYINLICILGLCFFKFKKQINNKLLYNLCKYSIIFALILIVLDTEVAGILPRYFGDFNFLFAISTIIVILSLLQKEIPKDFKNLILIFIFISMTYNFFTYFLGRHMFQEINLLRIIYYQIYYGFMFWL